MATLRAYDNADVGLNVQRDSFFGPIEDQGTFDADPIRPSTGGNSIITVQVHGNSLFDLGKIYGRLSGDSFIISRLTMSERGSTVSDITGIPTEFGDASDLDIFEMLSGNDKVFGNSFADRITGHAGNDSLYGNGGNDRLFDNQGRDALNGGNGHDRLSGGLNADRLRGDAGNDRLDGGQGNDRLTGGTGADTFVFRQGDGRDTVRDFNANGDHIEIKTGASSFGELTIVDTGNDVTVESGNVTITLLDVNAARISASDFLFT